MFFFTTAIVGLGGGKTILKNLYIAEILKKTPLKHKYPKILGV